ncbi:hypothetical protein DXB54_01630 [Coprococcus sp. OM04-5BH]|jgi:hypothetical protein|uniref:hypothetical protein n=1 Tax=Coprococcus sp. OM04-5BH TaxID=2293093 RepID=UPI000E538E0B|nr:hypothetical protein [Coprococcus sp. OM04-5BH]RHV34133.1 hypothetical protein DXB54_01630 [Coprococcus sp. OM04-5BH]
MDPQGNMNNPQMNNQQFGGQPMNGQQYGQPMNGQQFGGQPMGGQQYGQPMGGPQYGQPMGGQQYGQPMGGPQYGQPMGGPQYGQPMGGQQYRPQPNPVVTNCIQGFLGLLTSPADAIRNLMSSANIATGSIFIGLHAIVSFLFVLISLAVIGGKNLANPIFYALIMVIVLEFAVAGVATLLIGIVFRGGVNFNQAITATGIAAAYGAVAVAASCIISLLAALTEVRAIGSFADILYRSIMFVGIMLAIKAVMDVANLNPNQKIIAAAATVLVCLIVCVFLDFLGGKIADGTTISNIQSVIGSADWYHSLYK